MAGSSRKYGSFGNENDVEAGGKLGKIKTKHFGNGSFKPMADHGKRGEFPADKKSKAGGSFVTKGRGSNDRRKSRGGDGPAGLFDSNSVRLETKSVWF